MLYQIVNENLVRAFPNYIVIDGVVYTNELAEEKARESGEWFELIVAEQPEYDEETQYLVRKYIQGEEYIYQEWIIKDKEEEITNE